MILERTEIVTVDFPFSDLIHSKQRPVVVITPQDRFGDFTCLAVTSRETHEYSVGIKSSDMLSGILPKNSWVRFDKIFTLNYSLVRHSVGLLNARKYEELVGNLCDFLGCKK